MGRQFIKSDVEIHERERVYQRFFAIEKISLRHRLFNGGWSGVFTRELFVRGPAVAAVLYDPVNQLIGLVEQFRIGIYDSESSPWCKEVVAGISEPNELDDDVIIRELQEEAGVIPEVLHKICHYYSSPGGTNERLTLYCALADLSQAGGIFGLPQENEDIKMLVLKEDDVFQGLYHGEYSNAATLICLQWLMMNKTAMQERYRCAGNNQ